MKTDKRKKIHHAKAKIAELEKQKNALVKEIIDLRNDIAIQRLTNTQIKALEKLLDDYDDSLCFVVPILTEVRIEEDGSIDSVTEIQDIRTPVEQKKKIKGCVNKIDTYIKFLAVAHQASPNDVVKYISEELVLDLPESLVDKYSDE
jgi:ribosomal protein S13